MRCSNLQLYTDSTGLDTLHAYEYATTRYGLHAPTRQPSVIPRETAFRRICPSRASAK